MNLVLIATDRLTVRNVDRVAVAMGLNLVQTAGLADLGEAEPPVAVVIDLELDDGLSSIEESKRRWPHTMVVGLVSMPGGELWSRAEAAGCDVVTTRGAVAKVVPKKLARWMEAPGGRRLRLFALADVAGRLGVIERIEDPSLGPLAVYHVGGQIVVAQDTCPHAGAKLSFGDVSVDECLVTCPEHGSRFDVCSGQRVRGPADEGLVTYRVVIEDTQVYVELGQA